MSKAMKSGLVKGAVLLSLMMCLCRIEIAYAIPVNIAASSDTFIAEWNPNQTFGSDNFLYSDRGHCTESCWRTFPLIKFDLTSFVGSIINSPTGEVRLELIAGHLFPTQSVSVREVLVAWNENTTNFANFGGSGINESTHTGPNLVTQTVTFSGVAESVPFVIPSTVIQGWIDNPSTNFGLILISNTTDNQHTLAFSSREGNVSPTLSFDVTPRVPAVPEPGTVGLLGLGLAGLICVGRKRRYY